MPDTIHSEKYRRFCRLLIQSRREADLTQEEVAERLDKPQSFVSKYERGQRRLDVVGFLRITDALGANPLRIVRELGST